MMLMTMTTTRYDNKRIVVPCIVILCIFVCKRYQTCHYMFYRLYVVNLQLNADSNKPTQGTTDRTTQINGCVFSIFSIQGWLT